MNASPGRHRRGAPAVVVAAALAGAVAGVVLAGCGGGGVSLKPGPPQGTVTVTGTDHGLNAPMAFTPATVTLKRGTWIIHFVNAGTLFHDLSITNASGSKVLFGTAAQPGASADLTVTLGDGTYPMVCLEPGHRQMGMVGTVTVTA